MSFFTMAGSALANMFRKPATRMYPAEQRQYSAATRGRIELDVSLCVFCGICNKKCPTSAIAVQRAAKTWEIERLKCIACGNCCEVCPKGCLLMANLYSLPVSISERDTTQEVVKGA